MPGWRVVWFAPTPRSSGGRSAEQQHRDAGVMGLEDGR